MANRVKRTDLSNRIRPNTPHASYVEFIGLSGSGKSTIASALKEKLEHRGLYCLTRTPLIHGSSMASMCLNGLSHFKHIDWNLIHTYILNNKKQKHIRTKIRKLLSYLSSQEKYRRAINEGNTAVIIDEGFAQWISKQVATDCMVASEAARLVEQRLPPQAIVVDVELPAEIAWERRLMRADGLNLASMGRIEYLAWARTVRESLSRLSSNMSARGIDVFPVNGTLRPEVNADLIAEHVILYWSEE